MNRSLLLVCLLALVTIACGKPTIILQEDGHSSAPLSPSTPSTPSTTSPIHPSHTHAQLRAAIKSRVDLYHHPSLGRPQLYEAITSGDEFLAGRASQALNCTVCETLVTAITPWFLENSTQTDLVDIATIACEFVHPLCTTPAACQQVCTGIVSEYTGVVEVLIHELFTPINVCAAIKECPAPPQPSPSTAIPVPSNLKNTTGEVEWPSWSLTNGTGYFIHLSDGHIDPTYVVGSMTDCGLPICCHATDGSGTNSTNTAGYWGDYHCDTTVQLAQNLFEYIAALDPAPDFILYTGDDPAHDVWKQSRAENLNALQLWNQLLADAFAETGIPIFNTLGNHETFPVNQFEGPGFDTWLYDAAITAWAPYLPADAQQTMAYGGYYQARVRPGLRVVSLNANYFTNDNFWIIANQTDSQDQMNWFADVLGQAQDMNEKVIVICHQPIVSWNSNIAMAFLNITEQYQSTIVNYFMGHTHFNQYQVLHDSAGQPMHLAFVGGSVVPNTAVNAGYLVYTYDRAAVAEGEAYSYLVDSAQAYWLNLTEANLYNNTNEQWATLRYDYMDAFDIPSLDPVSMTQLAHDIVTNTTLYQTYLTIKTKAVPQVKPQTPLGVECSSISNTDAEYHLCNHKSGVSEQEIQEEEAFAATLC